MAGAAGVVWPMATARIGSLSVCSLLLGGMRLREMRRRGTHSSQETAMNGARRSVRGTVGIARTVVLWAVSTAVLDTSGNLIFIAATRAGRLDVAAVLASLYPASTILLAAAMLGERPTRRQGWGMGVAAVAVVLVGR
jgi:drug/metabolite transporter (DMT)-like permease